MICLALEALLAIMDDSSDTTDGIEGAKGHCRSHDSYTKEVDMLKAYVWRDGKLHSLAEEEISAAVWFDLESPTPEEYALVASITGFLLPVYKDLTEIEMSSRLSINADVLTLSLPTVYNSDEMVNRSVCGFILSHDRLVTIRFSINLAFNLFSPSAPVENTPEAQHIFVSLLEAIVGRQADRLEKLREELEGLSLKIFHHQKNNKQPVRRAERDLQHILIILGQAYETISYIRDCQLGIARIARYVNKTAHWVNKSLRERLRLVRKDVDSLNEFSTHLTDKIQFLQDSTLGSINISQNSLIKVLTIVSIVGIPPTLVAGIYGMNFKDIPELSWVYGYGYAWGAMIFSALAPLIWFRKKGWV